LRFLYTNLFVLALPIVLLRLYWRGFKAPAYRLHWRERLGFYNPQKQTNVIWLHAVSVGEIEAALPLIKALISHYPQNKFLITTTTPTAATRINTVFGNKVTQIYLPYDIPNIIQRFLKHFQPKIALIMETEIWPNLFFAIKQAQIPLFILNARLSVKSCNGYQKIPALTKLSLSCVNMILTQTITDAQRFQAIGAETKQLQTVGNLKFALSLDPQLFTQAQQIRTNIFPDRFVWIIASTHAGEEKIFLNLYASLKRQIPELLLVLVPRHPERFVTVAKQIQATQLSFITRSSGKVCTKETAIYLADSMGELKLFYAAADVAFVGGSLVNTGGHNILEPAAIGIPIMFGKYMHNFQAIANEFLEHQAAIQCHNSDQIQAELLNLYQQIAYRSKLINNGKNIFQGHQDVINKILPILKPYL